MAHDDSLNSDISIPKKLVHRILASIVMIAFVLPVWGADKSKDEETLRNAATVLQGMIDSKNVPSDVVARANCVMVLPSVKKFGFGVGGSGGRGPLTCRSGKNFSGKWSAPAMYTIGGASFGLQAGGSSTDFVLLIMSQKGVDSILGARRNWVATQPQLRALAVRRRRVRSAEPTF
jgi:lipid-binding SYLF domain-containing protein